MKTVLLCVASIVSLGAVIALDSHALAAAVIVAAPLVAEHLSDKKRPNR